MYFEDKLGLKYKLVKRNKELCLLLLKISSNTKRYFYEIEVLGTKNVMLFMKINDLKKYEGKDERIFDSKVDRIVNKTRF